MCHKKSQVSKNRNRGRPRQFNREEALRKALWVFWHHGYEQATIAKLCEELNLTSPSIYCAFGNKGDLFLEAIGYYRKKYWLPVFERFLNEPNLRLALEKLLNSTTEILYSPESPCGCPTVVASMTLPGHETRLLEAINAMRAETRNFFATALRRAKASGQLPPETDSEALALALSSFLEGLSLQAKTRISPELFKKAALLGLKLLDG